PAQMPAIPSWTTEGAFGIARTTGTPSASRASIRAVRIAAATDSTVWSGLSSGPISPSSGSKSCGLTASTTRPAPAAASPFASVASIPYCPRSSPARSSRRHEATTSVGSRQPELSRPPSSDWPIFPQPRIAIRRFIARVYAARFAAFSRRARNREQTVCGAGEQVDAGESRPLAVGLEQLGRLPALDPPAADRSEQLHQTEVSLEAALEAAQAFQADDADGPGAEAPLPLQPVGDGRRRLLLQALELERAAQPGERRAAAGVQAEPAQLGRGEPREVRRRRRDAQPVAPVGRGAAEPPLHRPRLAGEDQLAAQRPEQGVGDGREPEGPEPAEPADGRAQHRVALEPEDEGCVVVVDRQAEPELGERLVARRAQADRAVRPLPGDGTSGRDDRVQDPVPKDPGRVRRAAGRERQRVRATGAKLGGDHRPSIVPAPAGRARTRAVAAAGRTAVAFRVAFATQSLRLGVKRLCDSSSTGVRGVR